jgi:hypothetical protein
VQLRKKTHYSGLVPLPCLTIIGAGLALHRAPYNDTDAGSKGADVLVSWMLSSRSMARNSLFMATAKERLSLAFLLRETPRSNPGGRLQLLATKLRHPRELGNSLFMACWRCPCWLRQAPADQLRQQVGVCFRLR